jgi:myo-inositol-1(or 4)-monophosphatase
MTNEAGSQIISKSWLYALMREAGDLTLQYFRKKLRTIDKPFNQGIVTEADLATEGLLKQRILERYPKSVFVAEESAAHGDWTESGLTPAARARLQAHPDHLIWIIDPIDGTTNFSKGNPYYCISVCAGGLSNQGHFSPIIGCILQPATGDLYAAMPGMGATCNDETMGPASPTIGLTIASASVCTGFGYQSGPGLQSLVQSTYELQSACLGVRINGAAALDLALTARGIFDAFFEYRLMPWDLAAGALIAREAGLRVHNLKNEEYSTFDHNNIVVSHPLIDGDLMTILSRARNRAAGP